MRKPRASWSRPGRFPDRSRRRRVTCRVDVARNAHPNRKWRCATAPARRGQSRGRRTHRWPRPRRGRRDVGVLPVSLWSRGASFCRAAILRSFWDPARPSPGSSGLSRPRRWCCTAVMAASALTRFGVFYAGSGMRSAAHGAPAAGGVHRRERGGLTQVQSPGLPADRPGRPELVNLRMRSAVQAGKLVGSGDLVCVAGQGLTGLPVREERSWT